MSFLGLACLSLSLLAAASPVPPDRGDLGAAYLRFERTAAAAPKSAEVRRAANLSFDGLTADFFTGNFARALVRLAEMEAGLACASQAGQDVRRATEDRLFLASHRFGVEPRLGAASSTQFVRVHAEALDGMRGASPPTHIVLSQQGRTRVLESAGLLDAGVSIPLGSPFSAGAVDVAVRMPAIGDVPIGRVFLFDGPPDERRRELSARMEGSSDRLDPSSLASLRARLDLAFGPFDRSRSADLLADPLELVRELEDELGRADRGQRPYAAPGDRWRVLRVHGMELPMRQYIPEGDGPFPLVIAFHGAGGDENLFFDGYGGGRLLEIARDRRIAVVCPPTVPFGVSPNVLAGFLEELAKDIRIDLTRVGLLGHSLGAVTASRLAVLRPQLLNGVVCIAGFADLVRKSDAPPRRVYLAEMDPIFALDAMRPAVEAARLRGEPIELVVVPNEGHTLVVGEVLDQAIDWLLARAPRTTASAPPAISAPSTRPMNTEVPAPVESETSPSAGPRK